MSETVPLWSVCSLNDRVLPESTPPDHEFEYVDISNVEQNHIPNELETYSFNEAPSRARRLASAGDIIISTVRTYLRAIAQVEESERSRVYSTGFAVLHPIPSRADSRYLSYVMTSDVVVDEIIATSVGVSYPAIQSSAIHRLRIPYHDLETQHRIADYLDRETGEIDAMIDKLDELAEMLKTRRQSAIDEVFLETTNFTPLWTLTTGVIDCPHTTPVADELGQYEAVRTASVRDGKYVPGNGLVVSEATARERNGENTPEPGDVFFTREAPAGEACIVPEGNFCLGQRMVLIKPDLQKLDSRFLIYAIYASKSQTEMELSAGGSTVVNLKLGTIRAMNVPAYDLETQRRIADHLDATTGKIDAMLAKVAELKALLTERRAALITDVVTGRKEVA